jgi:penicillin-binding protein 1A
MLTPEKKFERKAKEIILSVQINNHIKKDIRRTHKDLSSQEIDLKTKQKILELYSNLIFLGNNSYGVEVASQTYFAKSAKDLDILEATILA